MTSIKKVNMLLIENGMTGAELCRIIDVSNGVYSQWNTGRNKIGIKNLKKIADVFNVSVSDLLDDDNENPVINSDNGYDEKRKIVNEMFDQCSPEDQDLVIDFLKSLSHRRSTQDDLPKAD